MLLSLMVVIITSGCSWQISDDIDDTDVSAGVKTIIFNSDDPNGLLSRSIRNQLRLNGIKLVDKNLLHQNIPSLRVLNSNLSRDIASIFQNSYIAEYQIVLSASAVVIIPDENVYPINVKICRSFFNNSQMVLAKDAEQQIIINEMYNKIAEELIRKLLKIKVSKNK